MARHVIFDFFGTLVSYNRGVDAGECAHARAELAQLGAVLGAREFVAEFDACFAALEEIAHRTLEEFSMDDAALTLFSALDLDADSEARRRFVDAYLLDWSRHVEPLPRVDRFLAALDCGKSVISNTHERGFVSGHLERIGVARAFDHVTASIEHGFRKPHSSIYEAHLSRLGLTARDVVFVGDDPVCDFFGPRAAGIEAFLIAPRPVTGVPESQRIAHLFELPHRLER